jgi:rhodanese-related sulfurtransferase
MVGISALRRRLAAVVVALACVAAGPLALEGAAADAGAGAAPAVTSIDGAGLARLVGEAVTVIDVRRADEWRETGVVAGSRLITAFDAGGRLDPGFVAAVEAVAARDQPLVLICRTGNRSGKAAEILATQAGYSRLYNVEGGVRDWSATGRPLAPCPTC